MGIFDRIKKLLNSMFENRNNQESSLFTDKCKQYSLGPTIFHCKTCQDRDKKIYMPKDEPKLPEHEKCKYFYLRVLMEYAGTATTKGTEGVDFYLKFYGIAPSYYINKNTAENNGWVQKNGNLSEILPGKMIGGNVYNNVNKRLPDSPGRIWYEYDINYITGKRNAERILYSNDGLIFKTTDHYETFIWIE